MAARAGVARADAARHRPAPPPHAPGSRAPCSARIDLPGDGLGRARRTSSRPALARRARVLPCGVDMQRFRPIAAGARAGALGLDPEPAVPAVRRRPGAPGEAPRPRRGARRGRRRRAALARRTSSQSACRCTSTPPTPCSCPSEREGFGLAVLEALACDVPVLATPVGIHAEALDGVAGTLCAPYELARWRAALAPLLAAGDPRVRGRARAERYSAKRLAERVAEAWAHYRARARWVAWVRPWISHPPRLPSPRQRNRTRRASRPMRALRRRPSRSPSASAHAGACAAARASCARRASSPTATSAGSCSACTASASATTRSCSPSWPR